MGQTQGSGLGTGVSRVVLRRLPDERMGAGPVTEGEAREGVDTPAATETEDALSMYFSMRRSLFQFMLRSNKEAVLSSTPNMLDMWSTSAAESFSTACWESDSCSISYALRGEC